MNENIINEESRLYAYKGEDRVIPATELKAELSNTVKAVRSYATGLSRLDDAIGKLETGELIAIGGPTKNGKTLLCQTMTTNLSNAGARCLWFTFEVPPYQFLQQMGDHCDFFMPRQLKQSNPNWLAERIHESKIKHDTRVVFIDNLHHLLDFTSVRNVALDMGVLVRQLKRTAIELNVCVVILCHSKKPNVDQKGKVPEVSEWDLRDSSFIPQEADATIMVQRKVRESTGEVTNQAIVKVCLHRRSGTMGRKIHVIKTGSFLEEDVTFYV